MGIFQIYIIGMIMNRRITKNQMKEDRNGNLKTSLIFGELR
jgi:hypothetical protein